MCIDWPKTRGTTPEAAEAQKREFIQILDSLEVAGANAVLLQVRPMADALYRSTKEPWSSYITGKRGAAPAEGWDPLKFAIDEAHNRGMELHAWVNPFRFAIGQKGNTPQDQQAINRKLIISHKNASSGKIYSIFDPGNPEAVNHLVAVCREIVRNYDIDGMIFDDYFYPDGMPLPAGMDKETAANQRRGYVNSAVKAVYAMIQKEKPWVRFGIAPAGVGGGNGKATARYNLLPPTYGSDWMYDRIYCDPLAWLAEGSVDYVSPQIYWPTNHSTNPYEPIADWWAGIAKHFKRHVYGSHNLTNIASTPAHWREQGKQIDIDRKWPNPGSILYSMASMSGKRSGGLANYLGNHQWEALALAPSMTWKHARNPGKITGLTVGSDGQMRWNRNPAGRYVIYAIPDGKSPAQAKDPSGMNYRPQYIVGVSYTNSYVLPDWLWDGYRYAVAPYDRFGNEWPATLAE